MRARAATSVWLSGQMAECWRSSVVGWSTLRLSGTTAAQSTGREYGIGLTASNALLNSVQVLYAAREALPTVSTTKWSPVYPIGISVRYPAEFRPSRTARDELKSKGRPRTFFGPLFCSCGPNPEPCFLGEYIVDLNKLLCTG